MKSLLGLSLCLTLTIGTVFIGFRMLANAATTEKIAKASATTLTITTTTTSERTLSLVQLKQERLQLVNQIEQTKKNYDQQLLDLGTRLATIDKHIADAETANIVEK